MMHRKILTFWFTMLLMAGCSGGDTLVETLDIKPDTASPTDAASPTETAHNIAAAVPTSIVLPTITAPVTETTGSEPVVKLPAGELLAFYSERDGNAEIYTMRADGSGPVRWTSNGFEDVSPAWSPDSSRIVFISDRDDPDAGGCFPDCLYQLYAIEIEGGAEYRLVESDLTAHHPAWRPDGAQISFDTEFNLQGDIYTINADGSDLQLLIEDGFWADWSPDGKWIAFASTRDGNVEIYLADANGNNPRRLTDDPRMDLFPAWSPDGERIAFMAGQGGTRQVYLMDADGGNQQQLTFKGAVSEDPAWSPDGEWIAFQSNRDGNYEIYILNIDAELQSDTEVSTQRLTTATGGDYWAAWKPAAVAGTTSVAFQKSEQVFPNVPTWNIGLADLDADGDLDAVFANGQRNPSQVWLNDGSGQFNDSGQDLGNYGHGVAVGDVDGDGDTDIVISTHNTNPTRVYLNDGRAVFDELDDAFAANIGYSIDLYDLDGDGDLDAVGEENYLVNVYWNDGLGNYMESELKFPVRSDWGDLNADGAIDMFLKEEGIGYSVFLNDGKARFTTVWEFEDPETISEGDIALADVDGDGDLDAVVTSGFYRTTRYPVRIWFNDGAGQFSDSGQRLSAVNNAGVNLGDLDADGDLDLVLADHEEPCQIWLNDGSGTFLDSGFRFGDGQFYRHVHLADLDGDDDLDIFLATFGMREGPNEVWFNLGQ